MRKRRCTFAGWPSVGVWVVLVTACDQATPHPGSGQAPADASVDRVFLGTGGDGGGGRVEPAGGSTLRSNGGASGGRSAGGLGGVAGNGARDGLPTGGSAGGPGGRAGGHGGWAGGAGAAGGGGKTAEGEAAGGQAGARASSGAAGGTEAAGSGGAGAAGATGSAGAGGSGGTGGAPAGPPIPPPVVGDLAITELLINPMGTDTGREWIEILNGSTHAVDLANVHVADAVNDALIDFAILAGAPPVLTAGGRAVLIQSADAARNGGVVLGAGGLVPVGGAFGTRVSLNNEADTISLCAGPCAEGVVLDRVVWDASLGTATAYEGHALSIDDRGRRCPATAPFGDAGSFGTPGATNPPCP